MPAWAAGARARERKADGPGWFAGCGEKEREGWAGWAAGKRERGKGKRFSFLKKILFKFIFQTFKLHSNKKPCIRIIMHKHLLFLILSK
jgi:hypothetical protein